MAIYQVHNTLSLAAEGTAAAARINRRRELFNVPWPFGPALDGRIYAAGAGTETTPYTLGNTVVDADQPEFLLRVPSGRTVIPLNILVNFEATGGALVDIMATVASNDPGDGTSTAADIAPKTLGMNIGTTPSSSARQLVTANLTLNNQVEFWREGDPYQLAAGQVSSFKWAALVNGGIPVLKGPACLTVHQVAATSGTGNILVTFMEFATSEVLA